MVLTLETYGACRKIRGFQIAAQVNTHGLDGEGIGSANTSDDPHHCHFTLRAEMPRRSFMYLASTMRIRILHRASPIIHVYCTTVIHAGFFDQRNCVDVSDGGLALLYEGLYLIYGNTPHWCDRTRKPQHSTP